MSQPCPSTAEPTVENDEHDEQSSSVASSAVAGTGISAFCRKEVCAVMIVIVAAIAAWLQLSPSLLDKKTVLFDGALIPEQLVVEGFGGTQRHKLNGIYHLESNKRFSERPVWSKDGKESFIIFDKCESWLITWERTGNSPNCDGWAYARGCTFPWSCAVWHVNGGRGTGWTPANTAPSVSPSWEAPSFAVRCNETAERALTMEVHNMDLVIPWVNGSDPEWLQRRHTTCVDWVWRWMWPDSVTRWSKATIDCLREKESLDEAAAQGVPIEGCPKANQSGPCPENVGQEPLGLTSNSSRCFKLYVKEHCDGRVKSIGDHDELRYLLRSLQKNLPWHTGRILLIVPQGQVPHWLKGSSNVGRLKVVSQEDLLSAAMASEYYVPAGERPGYGGYAPKHIFNDFPVEHALAFIPEASRFAFLVQDDLVLARPMSPCDLFSMPFAFKHSQGLSKGLSDALDRVVGRNSRRQTTSQGLSEALGMKLFGYPLIEQEMMDGHASVFVALQQATADLWGTSSPNFTNEMLTSVQQEKLTSQDDATPEALRWHTDSTWMIKATNQEVNGHVSNMLTARTDSFWNAGRSRRGWICDLDLGSPRKAGGFAYKAYVAVEAPNHFSIERCSQFGQFGSKDCLVVGTFTGEKHSDRQSFEFPVTVGRYWRFRIFTSHNGDGPTIHYLALLLSVDSYQWQTSPDWRVNAIPGGAKGVLEGNAQNFWIAEPSSGHWVLDFDLRSEHEVSGVSYKAESASESPKGLNVLSCDALGTKCVSVIILQGSRSAERQEILFPQTGSFRFWRFQILGSHDGGRLQLQHIEFLTIASLVEWRTDPAWQVNASAELPNGRIRNVLMPDAWAFWNGGSSSIGWICDIDLNKAEEISGMIYKAYVEAESPKDFAILHCGAAWSAECVAIGEFEGARHSNEQTFLFAPTVSRRWRLQITSSHDGNGPTIHYIKLRILIPSGSRSSRSALLQRGLRRGPYYRPYHGPQVLDIRVLKSIWRQLPLELSRTLDSPFRHPYVTDIVGLHHSLVAAQGKEARIALASFTANDSISTNDSPELMYTLASMSSSWIVDLEDSSLESTPPSKRRFYEIVIFNAEDWQKKMKGIPPQAKFLPQLLSFQDNLGQQPSERGVLEMDCLREQWLTRLLSKPSAFENVSHPPSLCRRWQDVRRQGK